MISLSKSIREYLFMRRKLGFELRNTEKILNQFEAYMKQQKEPHITSELALAFATRNQRASLVWQAKKLGVVRRFTQYHYIFDPKTEIPQENLLPNSYHRQQPYIYSDKEIKQILRSCQKFIAKHSIHAWTLYAFLGLIAVTGMRIGEAISLSRESVDLKLGIITILESKNKKSRKIPIHPSVTRTLKQYSSARDRFLKKTPQYFFVDDHGQKLNSQKVRTNFKKLCALAGILKKDRSPTITGFRHTFAVKTLENCYSKGINHKNEISILAMYLGHENPRHTYWYLTATPTLMKSVAIRLEKKYGGKK